MQTETDAHLHGTGSHSKEAHTHSAGAVGVGATGSAHTTEYTKESVAVSGGAHAHGETRVHETLVQDGQLLEDEEWVTDDKGVKTKQKRGFFGHLKDKITGHHAH